MLIKYKSKKSFFNSKYIKKLKQEISHEVFEYMEKGHLKNGVLYFKDPIWKDDNYETVKIESFMEGDFVLINDDIFLKF